MALDVGEEGPVFIAVNPGSLLGTRMAKDVYGMVGGDIRIGSEIHCRAVPENEFAAASGQYFDNDAGQSSSPHPDDLNQRKSQETVRVIQIVLAEPLQ